MCLETLVEKTISVPVVGADIDPAHPDRSAFHILIRDLQLLAPFLDASDADSRSVPLAPGLLPPSVRAKRRSLLLLCPNLHISTPQKVFHFLEFHCNSSKWIEAGPICRSNFLSDSRITLFQDKKLSSYENHLYVFRLFA